ncbi:MAG: hypothetical protein Kow00109_15990 [Acidobacteriota bacterium]
MDQLRLMVDFTLGLRRFLGSRLERPACRELVLKRKADRCRNFLTLLRRAVFANPRSPYRRLLDSAGVTFQDVEAQVVSRGLEAALDELLRNGIFLTIDEFKGRVPVRRGSLEFGIRPGELDNPMSAGHFESRTGGSRGRRTRLVIDLELLTHEAAELAIFLDEFQLWGVPAAMWREPPPGIVGVKNWLRYAKLGERFERWFALRRESWMPKDLRFMAFATYSGILGRLLGNPLPSREYLGFEEASRVAAWLAGKKAKGEPALLDTNPSTGIRVCLAARDAGWDIAGSFFRFSAEPYTPAKAQIVEAAGCRAASFYSASEIGFIGMPCGCPRDPDEVHLMTDKVAVIRREKTVGPGVKRVDSLLFTSLLACCPKVLLNVELGDYATGGERRCGCYLEELGFDTHLHEIRSFEKLTSHGANFLGADVLRLVEHVLPARFGGSPLDYQFVEQERGGVSEVKILVDPRLGDIDESRLLETVFEGLAGVHAGETMTRSWRQGGTLRVERRTPIATRAMKLLPLLLVPEAEQQPAPSQEGRRLASPPPGSDPAPPGDGTFRGRPGVQP